jgi:hypothetical protein
MDPLRTPGPGSLIERLLTLDARDGYIVLVVDPETSEADAYGPYDGLAATTTADRLRRDFDTGELADVHVNVIRLHHPTATNPCRT